MPAEESSTSLESHFNQVSALIRIRYACIPLLNTRFVNCSIVRKEEDKELQPASNDELQLPILMSKPRNGSRKTTNTASHAPAVLNTYTAPVEVHKSPSGPCQYNCNPAPKQF
ncbi:hypothetical protein VNO77_02425 [Canavalia gladiata]|uniref:Uncharacterized protein n=1 Tax=Canavalia gladiata TaxID=3824 RepID=A0AAN9MTN6_CANGL